MDFGFPFEFPLKPTNKKTSHPMPAGVWRPVRRAGDHRKFEIPEWLVADFSSQDPHSDFW